MGTEFDFGEREGVSLPRFERERVSRALISTPDDERGWTCPRWVVEIEGVGICESAEMVSKRITSNTRYREESSSNKASGANGVFTRGVYTLPCFPLTKSPRRVPPLLVDRVQGL